MLSEFEAQGKYSDLPRPPHPPHLPPEAAWYLHEDEREGEEEQDDNEDEEDEQEREEDGEDEEDMDEVGGEEEGEVDGESNDATPDGNTLHSLGDEVRMLAQRPMGPVHLVLAGERLKAMVGRVVVPARFLHRCATD